MIDGIQIRYADSGGPHEPVLLLTSPWPESLYAFARMWNTLAEHTRLFAVDLPGFGASERRDELLSPRAMGEFLAQLVEEVDLGRPHIIAPDVGTSAALFAAAAHRQLFVGVIGGAAVPPAARAAVPHAARAGTAGGLNNVLLAAAAFAALGAIAGFAVGPDPARQPPPSSAAGELSAESAPPSTSPRDRPVPKQRQHEPSRIWSRLR
jgi:pimeloyl-ACP methyl ester carboxylesterase